MTRQQAKRRVALKGQSRSKFCGEPIRRGSKTPCLRLQGHAGKHRPTTFRHEPRPVGTAIKDAEPTDQPVAIIEVKPEPTIIAAVEVERRVAAPSKTAKRRNSGQPTVPSAKPTRSKIG